MEGFDFNIALTTFYVFVSSKVLPSRPSVAHRPFQYVIADIPSNLLLKQFGSTWLAFLVIGFGLVSLASAFLHNMGGLLASRVFLGLTEGGTLVRNPHLLSVRSADVFVCQSGLVYIISRVTFSTSISLR